MFDLTQYETVDQRLEKFWAMKKPLTLRNYHNFKRQTPIPLSSKPRLIQNTSMNYQSQNCLLPKIIRPQAAFFCINGKKSQSQGKLYATITSSLPSSLQSDLAQNKFVFVQIVPKAVEWAEKIKILIPADGRGNNNAPSQPLTPHGFPFLPLSLRPS